jgi:pyruvate formate lyase activating enzyme
MSETVNIFNIQHFSLHDGPGIRTVLFFKGCPLDCAWCHNPEGKSIQKTLSFLNERCVFCRKCESVCPQGAHSFQSGEHMLSRENCICCGKCVDACNYGALETFGKEYTIDEILSEIEKDKAYYGSDGGVTISGGEPFMQFEALITLLKALKEKGYHVCIETSGYTTSERILEAAKYTDLFLYDYKESDNERHIKYTGVSQDKILNNLNALDDVGARLVLRCPIIPSVNDYNEHFEKIAQIASKHASIQGVELMPYHPLGISKAINIGKDCAYKNNNFADASLIENCRNKTQQGTSKIVTVSK